MGKAKSLLLPLLPGCSPGPDELLKNVLAVYSNVEFVRGDESKPAGQIDVFLEGMRKADLE